MATLENMGMMLAVVGTDVGAIAVSGDALSVGQIVAYIVTILVGGGAAWKVLPILLARLSVTLAGAKSEQGAIERLERQLAAERQNAAAELAVARQEAAQARQDANTAYKERNDILRELGDVKAQLAGLTERATAQAQTIERQNQLITELTAQIQKLNEAVHGKNS
ncbi:Uncharacterized protein conserved in bacteria with the myosin-like domain [Bordetella ansorpii]|uniref:Uncharacterized protein conserved in bacteria with the myosin-like domain n=1 Tax=Bordetella ansorpii TaxID=288768 RepID=A0A157RLK7_9BORD|nr:hypothetical protein [Bordetella ansorpii]SAI58881.1 Uncharacterized protein conserved in bacteria with the myosin-like domain [Bordetella ansorpii]